MTPTSLAAGRRTVLASLHAVALVTACGSATETAPIATTPDDVAAPDAESSEAIVEADDADDIDAETLTVDPCPAAEADAARLLGEVDAALRDLAADDGVLPRDHAVWEEISTPLRECLPAGRGAWMLRPIEATFRLQPLGQWAQYPEDVDLEVPHLRVRWRLTWLAPDGETRLEGPDREVQYDVGSGDRHHVSVISFVDYDDDGLREIVLHDVDAFHEGRSESWGVYSVVDGALREYPPSASIAIDRVTDVDTDGRPDLYSSTTFWGVQQCGGMNPPPLGLPQVLHHATADGLFSTTDDVAAAHLREQCPVAPATLLVLERGFLANRSFVNVACARVWGASVEETRRRLSEEIDRAFPEAPEEFSCEAIVIERLYEHAEVEPPMRLR